MKEIVGKVWPWIISGIAAGAFIHGYVPSDLLASIMGRGAWWSVPAAVLIGIPMYSSAAGIIPVVEALLTKGAALGTVLAFMMSVIALSLPAKAAGRRWLGWPAEHGGCLAICGPETGDTGPGRRSARRSRSSI